MNTYRVVIEILKCDIHQMQVDIETPSVPVAEILARNRVRKALPGCELGVTKSVTLLPQAK